MQAIDRAHKTVELSDGRRLSCGQVTVLEAEIRMLARVTASEISAFYEMARTSDPAIVAAGDCTSHPSSLVPGQHC